MTDITRRRFIEAAGVAAAATPAWLSAHERDETQGAAQAQAQVQGDDREAASRRTTRARDLTDAELEAMFHRCSNAGRWGVNDELGTLNYITPRKRIAAAALVKAGEVVSVGRDLTTRQSKTNPQPVVHTMNFTAAGPSSGDSLTVAPHGMVVTHMDALCHFSWNDQFYNGRKRSESLTPSGSRWGSIYAQRQGIFTRGVLLDVAAARGVNWYAPDEYVTVADFEAAEKRQRVRVGSGDVLFVRTGMERMEAELGEQDIYPRAGLHAECAEWMHRRQVSVYGGDCIEKLPYPSERFTSAVHMIVLASMGLPILDWPALTELARTCERVGRWEYLLTTAPLRLPGGTSSPINPLCIF
jgi:kynurenine formamidase